MSFQSYYAPKIFSTLYKVYIPDQLTLSPDYLKIFGTHVTGNKEVDDMLSKNTTLVMVDVITILDYYEQGFLVEIPSREDMIQIHKDIEGYLGEWREHIRHDINNTVHENKQMLLSLEKLSKDIYNKAKTKEVINDLFNKEKFGLVSPLERMAEERKEHHKPDYQGIGSLVRSKTSKPLGRF